MPSERDLPVFRIQRPRSLSEIYSQQFTFDLPTPTLPEFKLDAYYTIQLWEKGVAEPRFEFKNIVNPVKEGTFLKFKTGEGQEIETNLKYKATAQEGKIEIIEGAGTG